MPAILVSAVISTVFINPDIYIFYLEAVRLQERNATNPQLISNKHVVQVNMHASTRLYSRLAGIDMAKM